MRRLALWLFALATVAGVVVSMVSTSGRGDEVDAATVVATDAGGASRGLHTMNTPKAEDSLIGGFYPPTLAAHGTSGHGFHSSPGDEGPMPDLYGAIGWLNSAPLSRKSLRGKVALVDFWTYTCINSLRPLPYVKNWAAQYSDAGLAVIGVHTPEFSFEHEPMNVENAVRSLNVTFPVAIDSNYRIWESFNNQYWPAQCRRKRADSVPPLWGKRL